jgi:hypothetical protein
MPFDQTGFADLMQRLSAASARLATLIAEAVAEWAPDAPPPTVVMGSVGRALVEHCDEFTDGELAIILGTVEDVLLSQPESIKDIVATGLLEAVLHAGDKFPLPLARVMRFVGPQSRAYCEAWNEFCGVETNPRR